MATYVIMVFVHNIIIPFIQAYQDQLGYGKSLGNGKQVVMVFMPPSIFLPPIFPELSPGIAALHYFPLCGSLYE